MEAALTSVKERIPHKTKASYGGASEWAMTEAAFEAPTQTMNASRSSDYLRNEYILRSQEAKVRGCKGPGK